MDFNQYFKSRQGEMINLLKELVRRESPTSDKKAVDACSAYLADQFRNDGRQGHPPPQKEVRRFPCLRVSRPKRTGLSTAGSSS